MTAGGDGKRAVAGGLARHIPVLARRAVELLDVRGGAVYVDATFGGGGYAGEILAAADCTVVGIDRDRGAIARAAELEAAAGGRLVLVEDRFSNLREIVQRAASTRSMASSSTSASPRCRSTRPSAGSPSASMARSTCAWAARDRPLPTWWRRHPSATLRR